MTTRPCSCGTDVERLTTENEQLRNTVQALRKALALVTEAQNSMVRTQFDAQSSLWQAQAKANELVSDALGLWTYPKIPNN
ncbi:Uncharacterised protein [Mycobacteroides abscessus subsp. massiliense]|nr:Uncharacterised protein [Mycobacteroides abscessus subsp. massiliense]